MKKFAWIMAVVLAAFVIGCGGTDKARPIDDVAAKGSAPANSTSTETSESGHSLTASDFQTTVKIKSKDCFEGYGCNLVYEVQVAVDKPKLAKDDHSYEVTYEVKGNKDGVQTGTVTIDPDGAYSQYDEVATTKSRGSKLVPHITTIERLPY